MSVSLDSWESINYTVQKFFKPDLRPYYNDEYVKILLDIIGQSIGKNSFNYVNTIVSLAEPIWHTDNAVIISLPMIEYLLDQPIKLPETKIIPIKNFDIFENFNVLKNQNTTHYGASIYEHDAKNEYLVRWDETDNLSDHNGNAYTSINNSQIISLVMIMRLTLCVAHWLQHYKLKKRITDHENFPIIELADLKKLLTLDDSTVSITLQEIHNSDSSTNNSSDDDYDTIKNHDESNKTKRKLKKNKLRKRCDKLKQKYGADIDKYNPSKKYKI